MTKLILVTLIVAIFMIVATIANPVPAVETAETKHDLDTAEILLEIIEKKIAKLYKKCLKHGGCQPHYHHYDYGHSGYGYGSGYGSGYGGGYY